MFKARKQAHSKLCNCLCNAEDGQKDQSVVGFIKFTFLSNGCNWLVDNDRAAIDCRSQKLSCMYSCIPGMGAEKPVDLPVAFRDYVVITWFATAG